MNRTLEVLAGARRSWRDRTRALKRDALALYLAARHTGTP